jgi:thiamine biosynthesis protein ThiI
LSKAAQQVVLVASSEFTLKSSPVRRTLEQRLIDDLKFALTRASFEGFRIEKEAARLVVIGAKGAGNAAIPCSSVFGVAYAAPAQLLMNVSLKDVTGTIASLAQQRLKPGQSFAVRAHRSTPGSIARRDVEVNGGAEVLQVIKDRGVTVDLDAPDLTFYVDLVGDDAYVYCDRLQGPGGLPLSSQWKMLGVLDSGSLSILAAYAMMRRGCVVELFIPTSGMIDSLAAGAQLGLARRLDRLVTRPNYKAFTLEIDPLLEKSSQGVRARSDEWKKLVRSLAARFAKEKRFRALVLGDVSGNLETSTVAKAELPVFYPLLGLEEDDLAELSNLTKVSGSNFVFNEELEYRLSPVQGRDIGFTAEFGDLVHEVKF